MTEESKKPAISCEMVLNMELDEKIDTDMFIDNIVCGDADDKNSCSVEIKQAMTSYAKKELSDQEFETQIKEIGEKYGLDIKKPI